MNPTILIPSIQYVINDPFFWSGMGMLTACAMFIGATLYNGDFSMLKKGIVTICGYSFFLILITVSRVMNYAHNGVNYDSKLAFAGTITITVSSIFYLVGLFLGVFTVHYAKKK